MTVTMTMTMQEKQDTNSVLYTSIREDFAASQINLDLLSYQKNPRVMPSSSLRKLFEALKTTPLGSTESDIPFSAKNLDKTFC